MAKCFLIITSCVVALAACCCAVSRVAPVRRVRGSAHKLEQEKLQEEEEWEEAQKKMEEMEETEEVLRSTADAIDRIGMLIHEGKFGEAREVFDTNLHLITQSAAGGMADEDPEIAGLFKKWYDGLLEVREVLGREGLTPEKKRKLALEALMDAWQCKQVARQIQIFKH